MNNRALAVPFLSRNHSRYHSVPGEPPQPAELGAVEPGELDQIPPAREQRVAQLQSSEGSREQLALSHIPRAVKQRCGERD